MLAYINGRAGDLSRQLYRIYAKRPRLTSPSARRRRTLRCAPKLRARLTVGTSVWLLHVQLICRFLDAGNNEALGTLSCQASKKRQGTKSREVGPRLGSGAMGI